MIALRPSALAATTESGRLLASLLWVAAVATAPPGPVALLAAAGVTGALLVRHGARRLGRLLFPATVMVAGTTLPIAVSFGASHGLLVGARALLAVASAAALLGGTPASRLAPALRGLGIPSAVTTTLAAALRLSGLLVDEGRRLVLARRLRGDRSILAGGAVLGALFTRAVTRAERMDLAMALRGYRGEVTVSGPRLVLGDLPGIAAAAVLGVLVHVAPRLVG